jgi:hypothetical protein
MNTKEILEQLATLQKQVEALDNGEIVEEDGFVERIMSSGENTYVLKANAGYTKDVDVLCSIEDTGNGYIANFPSYSSCEQENYICMDYAEADYLRKLLTYLFKKQHTEI